MTVRAPLVDFDLEVCASTVLMAPLLEHSGKVCRVSFKHRLVQSKLRPFDLDDDRAIGMPKIWMGTCCGTRLWA